MVSCVWGGRWVALLFFEHRNLVGDGTILSVLQGRSIEIYCHGECHRICIQLEMAPPCSTPSLLTISPSTTKGWWPNLSAQGGEAFFSEPPTLIGLASSLRAWSWTTPRTTGCQVGRRDAQMDAWFQRCLSSYRIMMALKKFTPVRLLRSL